MASPALAMRFTDAEVFLRLDGMALEGMGLRSALVEGINAESRGALRAYTEGDALVFELGANLATARG